MTDERIIPTLDEAERIVERLLLKARHDLKRGTLNAVGVSVLPQRFATVHHELDFSSPMAKHRSFQQFVGELRASQAVAAIVVVRSWVTLRTPRIDDDERFRCVSPDQQSRRMDTISVSYVSRGITFEVILPFDELGDGNIHVLDPIAHGRVPLPLLDRMYNRQFPWPAPTSFPPGTISDRDQKARAEWPTYWDNPENHEGAR